MNSRLAGFVPAETVLQRTAEGTTFSEKANDINKGFEQVTPKDFGGDGAISTGLPTDIQGPNGFNLPNAASMNVVTDVNAAGYSNDGGLKFNSYANQTDLHQKTSMRPFPVDNDMDGI